MEKIIFFNDWGTEYLKRRYLEHDSLEDLRQREDELINNILTIGANGEAIVYRNEQFRELLSHVRAEYKIRNLPVPSTIEQKHYVSHKKAAELREHLDLPFGSYFLKFGNSEWMEQSLLKGTIRVANAKSYDASSLAPAIRDRELEFTEQLHGAKVELVPKDGIKRAVETVGNVKRISRCATDFYVASFGELYEPRLFDDFSRGGTCPYNCCLVIKDRDLFLNRMMREGERKLPGWEFTASPVAYSDPYNPVSGTDVVNVIFTKHFRYAYQREFRMAWIPPTMHEILKPIFFELGPLVDSCELITL